MTIAEIQQLQAWNQTDINSPQDQTLVTLFEQQVAKTPNKIAVVCEDRSLSYQELNQKANQLAHDLLQLKQEKNLPNNPAIAICLERSLLTVIVIFAITSSELELTCPSIKLSSRTHSIAMLESPCFYISLTTNSIPEATSPRKLQNPVNSLCFGAKHGAMLPRNPFEESCKNPNTKLG
ncbi:AMP-binding protein [Tolypothrix bouteillei VB521301_2]|uniref:AMP-binding protein n=1 Tax=Tolypothrix bouteillei TaxID=1246981 RepID=UPI0038B672B1